MLVSGIPSISTWLSETEPSRFEAQWARALLLFAWEARAEKRKAPAPAEIPSHKMVPPQVLWSAPQVVFWEPHANLQGK